MDLREFKQLPVMGILRGIEKNSIEPLTEQVISSGLKTIEVAMNTKDAPDIIRSIKKLAGNRLTVGAGTVLTLADLHSALDAGATFIVLPVLIHDVVKHCVKNNIPVFPGALTPQEIYNAWSAGASMVKVFPAKLFGPAYFREIKAPFNDIELLACGGVDKNSIKEFFACGASAVAFGASIFRKDLIKGGRFEEIRGNIKSLIEAI